MSALKMDSPFIANDEEAVVAKTAAERLRAVARAGHDIQVVVQDDFKVVVPLPARAVELIQTILETMGEREPFSMIPHEKELTTQEAADFLNVSRPFCIRLLDSGQIPHRKVGRHRRVRFADLLKFREDNQKRQTEALAALSDEERRLDLD